MAELVQPLRVLVREAEEGDMDQVARLYGHYVLGATCTFETEAPDANEMADRFRKVKAISAPYLVAEVDGAVAGYAYAAAYRARAAYRHTLENSVYVAPGFGGRGIGRRLLQELITQATKRDFVQMVAVIGDSANQASVKLHASLGFERVGVLRDVGFKHGRWLDTVLMQRALY